MKDGDKVNIGGLDVTIASMEACEQAEALICSRKAVPWTSPFDDNLEAPCSQCGETVIYRPHAPKTPAKVCIECFALRIEAVVQ